MTIDILILIFAINLFIPCVQTKFEDTKGAIEKGQTIQWPQEKQTKGHALIYKTLNKTLKIAQYELH